MIEQSRNFHFLNQAMQKLCLILGSEGALGREVVSKFRSANWRIARCDIRRDTTTIDGFIHLSPETSAEEGCSEIIRALSLNTTGSRIDAIINLSGGFVMDDAKTPELLRNISSMYKSSVQSSVIASHLAGLYLTNTGLLVLPGAAAVSGPTPWALTYGSMKAAVHHMVRSLGSRGSGLPEGSCVLGIAPVMLDTALNRKAMPHGDFTAWTPCDVLAEQILRWANGLDAVKSGSIVKVETKNGNTSYIEI